MEKEQSIIQGIADGDRKAMRLLYEQLAGYAMAVAIRYLPHVEDAKDVVHDSFIKAFSHIHDFNYRGDGSLRAWMTKIVTNEAINALRKTSRLTFVSDIPDEPDDDPPDVETVPPEEITRMIGLLPPGYRAVFNLFVFEQKSHKQIAAMLGIKENSSASQYLRAKSMLKKLINEYQQTRHDKARLDQKPEVETVRLSGTRT